MPKQEFHVIRWGIEFGSNDVKNMLDVFADNSMGQPVSVETARQAAVCLHAMNRGQVDALSMLRILPQAPANELVFLHGLAARPPALTPEQTVAVMAGDTGFAALQAIRIRTMQYPSYEIAYDELDAAVRQQRTVGKPADTVVPESQLTVAYSTVHHGTVINANWMLTAMTQDLPAEAFGITHYTWEDAFYFIGIEQTVRNIADTMNGFPGLADLRAWE